MWRKHIRKIQDETIVQVYTNAKGWWNSDLTINFYPLMLTNPILLLLGDFSSHWTTEVIKFAKDIGVTLMAVHPNATSEPQPADTTWNGPLERTPNAATWGLKAPDCPELCAWINITWGDVSPATICAGFKKCGLVEQCKENEEITEHTTELYENADDNAEEVLRAGLLEKEIGGYSLDADFDDMFRAVTETNE
ncbi:Hypothetical protein PHPALM_11792 [Phytophthora palmivora]|uniref:DDE-1 domain-containing protein n=1 Tax=Phytophthora palmivora TaxID=4796 RepID=A0A2P4Y1B4_9STRA|nr:Hypothetical protein PHPALM_11792 [Phytophthora palmivora]